LSSSSSGISPWLLTFCSYAVTGSFVSVSGDSSCSLYCCLFLLVVLRFLLLVLTCVVFFGVLEFDFTPLPFVLFVAALSSGFSSS